MTGVRRPAIASAAATLALALAAALAGCSEPSAPRLKVVQPYVPQPAASDLAAGYFTVRNDGGTADRLVKVTSTISGEVTMHRGSATKMEKADGFDVPAHGSLTLGRGGNHLMLEHLEARPTVGERVELELHFAKSRPIAVKAPVRPLGYRPPAQATAQPTGESQPEHEQHH